VPVALSFTAGVRLDISRSTLCVHGPGRGVLVLGEKSPGIVEVLRRLASGKSTYEALIERALARGGATGLRALQESLMHLMAHGWIAHRVNDRGSPIVSAIPLCSAYPLHVQPLGNRSCRLSRFAYLRQSDAELILESPTASAQIVFHDVRAMGLLWQLARVKETAAAVAPSGLPGSVIRATTDLLWTAGFLTMLSEVDGVTEDQRLPLLQWEFHDLVFHSRSRLGRHRSRYGATYPLEGRVAAPPAIRPRAAGKRFRLVRPRLGKLARTDWSLTRALETRQSRREHAATPITRRQLGEFLYRTSSLRSVNDHQPYQRSRRVYPSGGAAYAVEIYLAVRSCADLEAGLYHYCPERHDLRHIAAMTPDVRNLVAGAGRAARAGLPQIVVIMAARFLRTSWKYSSISYALILKDVGALMQTMYLVATTMDLAICAIGGGNSDLFARAAGTDYYSEGSVGELILGRPLPPFSRNSSSPRGRS
jgi:SagB-type dehydrogenase family enzyme